MSAVTFREITADVPSLFHVRTRTRENAMTLEQLQRLGINPRSVTESLGSSTKGWVCEDSHRVVAFSMADRATGEVLVIAVLPSTRKGESAADSWPWPRNGSRHRVASERGSRRISIPPFAPTASIALVAGPIGRSKEVCGGWSAAFLHDS